jgi:hypothetical protein
VGSLPQYANLARRSFPGLDELFSAGEHVHALKTHPGWAILSRVLEEEIAEIDFRLDERLLPTRSDYASLHGRRSGLRAMWMAADAIVEVAEKERSRQQAKHESAAEPVLGAA